MDKNKITGYLLLGAGIIVIAVAIGLLVYYVIKRRSQSVTTEPFYQAGGAVAASEPVDISSQIHLRYQFNNDTDPALYLTLPKSIAVASLAQPTIAAYSDDNSNGLCKIVDVKDNYDKSGTQRTVYFRLQPVTNVTADASKYYKFVFSTVTANSTGFQLVSGTTNDADEITVFSLKDLGDTSRQLNIHNVTLGDFKNLTVNRDKFYTLTTNAAALPPTWFTVLLLPSTTAITASTNPYNITYENTDKTAKLAIIHNPTSELITASANFAKFSPLPRVRDMSGLVLFDKDGYIQGTKIERNLAYPNTHYQLVDLETNKYYTYIKGDIGGRIDIENKANDKSQTFGIASAMNLNYNIKNPGFMFVVPLIESTKVRLDSKLGKLDIVTVGSGGFGIINADRFKLETDADYLTENCLRARKIHEYSLATTVGGSTTPYYIQSPIVVKSSNQIALSTYGDNSSITYVGMVSAGKDGQVYLYNKTQNLLLRVTGSGTYGLGWVDNLVDATPLTITPVTAGAVVTKNHILTVNGGKASAVVVNDAGSQVIMYKDGVADASKAKFTLAVASAPETPIELPSDIKTTLDYLEGVEATPETTTTTQATTTTTTTSAAAGTTTTQPVSIASASALSDSDLAKLDEMEKSTALLNERIAELKKDKQVLQEQLARLDSESLQISDSDYNSRASNTKLRRVLGGQMDKVADMLEKLKTLSVTSAAASAAAHGDYTQRGGTVKKTDTGVSVSDYEGVLNIFYPQFV